MSNSHKGSLISYSNKIIPVDKNTTFLAHYDITANDVLYGIEPTNNISTLRDGKFGGGMAIEESTTNLSTGAMSVYNNYASNGQMTSSITPLSETYMGQSIYRLQMTPISANAVTNVQTTLGSHGVMGSSMTYTSGNTFISSIYWRPVNKSDISVGGTASNIAGWTDVGTYIQNDGWNRSVSKWYDTTSRTDNKFWSFKSPSAVANETIIIDWVAPQIEQKSFATSYVSGTRAQGIVQYPIQIYADLFTINFWAKDVYNGFYIDLYATDGSNRVFFRPDSPTALDGGKVIGGAVNLIGSTTCPNMTGWHMYTLTSNGSAMDIYMDGVLIKTNSNVGTLGKMSSYLYLNNQPNRSSIFDELRIDNIERTAEEIQSWYISNQPFYPKGIYRLAY